jgi:hypothetical protein
MIDLRRNPIHCYPRFTPSVLYRRTLKAEPPPTVVALHAKDVLYTKVNQTQFRQLPCPLTIDTETYE